MAHHSLWAEVESRALIAGLIPSANGVLDAEVCDALIERAALIEQRASALVARALADEEPWLAKLGPPPGNPSARPRWERVAATVAAYRERHGVTDARDPSGGPSGAGNGPCVVIAAALLRLPMKPVGCPSQRDAPNLDVGHPSWQVGHS